MLPRINDDEPFIKTDLINKVWHVSTEDTLNDESFKEWEDWENLDIQEQRHLSELYDVLENFTQTDFAVCIIVALENYPKMVYQILAEEYLNNKERKNRNENNENV